MTAPRELLVHELGDVLYAEKLLVKVLQKLEKESGDEELGKVFREHAEETRGQVKNVEAAFKQLGEKPSAERCPGIEGIRQEHDEFVAEERPSPQIRDLFNAGSAARTEHYEIAAYTGIIAMARALKEREVVKLMDANLRQEKEALRKVERIGKRLGRKGS
jgi:ferritin-like metal-binding protein YciE